MFYSPVYLPRFGFCDQLTYGIIPIRIGSSAKYVRGTYFRQESRHVVLMLALHPREKVTL